MQHGLCDAGHLCSCSKVRETRLCGVFFARVPLSPVTLLPCCNRSTETPAKAELSERFVSRCLPLLVDSGNLQSLDQEPLLAFHQLLPFPLNRQNQFPFCQGVSAGTETGNWGPASHRPALWTVLSRGGSCSSLRYDFRGLCCRRLLSAGTGVPCIPCLPIPTRLRDRHRGATRPRPELVCGKHQEQLALSLPELLGILRRQGTTMSVFSCDPKARHAASFFQEEGDRQQDVLHTVLVFLFQNAVPGSGQSLDTCQIFPLD